MRSPFVALLLVLLLPGAAEGLVGGATVVRGTGAGRHIVMIVSTRGNLCTGTALARDLVLTAGHCVAPTATYRVLLPDIKPPGLAVRSITVHPRYNPKDYASGRVTADVALIKLEQPLPADIVPASLAPTRPVAPGDRFVIAGYGTTAHGSENGIGTARRRRSSPPASPAHCKSVCSIRRRATRAGARRLHRRFRRAGVRRKQRRVRGHRRGELVDRRSLHRRLRRPHRRDAASALPRLGDRDGAENGKRHRAVAITRRCRRSRPIKRGAASARTAAVAAPSARASSIPESPPSRRRSRARR